MRTARPGESALLLLDVLDMLATRNIEYAVVGAMAAAVYGAVRASVDADAVVSVGMHAAQALLRAGESAGFLAELTRGDPDDPIQGLLRLGDQYDNAVDLLIGLRGLDPQAFSRVLAVPRGP